jgi:hypothetical protein
MCVGTCWLPCHDFNSLAIPANTKYSIINYLDAGLAKIKGAW